MSKLKEMTLAQEYANEPAFYDERVTVETFEPPDDRGWLVCIHDLKLDEFCWGCEDMSR